MGPQGKSNLESVAVDAGTREEAGRGGGHVSEMQRRRLQSAMEAVVFEHGAQAVNVAIVCERAGVSRKTFYDIYDGREACLLAAFEHAVANATRALAQAVEGHRKWRDRIRAGLATLLSFLDHDPCAARLLVVEALSCGERTLSARTRVLAQVIAIVDGGRGEARRQISPLTAEGIVGAVFSVIHARVLDRDPRALAELTGPLMAMIVQPYLGPLAARTELDRPLPVSALEPPITLPPSDPFKDLPIRLTYRTARVLSSIADAPGASNKQVARASGVSDEGQMSRLLARLQRFGLICDTAPSRPARRGEAKAWMLTDRGEAVLRAVGGS